MEEHLQVCLILLFPVAILIFSFFSLQLVFFSLIAGMLDHILVETGGGKMPLNHVAVVSVLDSKTLSVTPYDPDVKFLILKP